MYMKHANEFVLICKPLYTQENYFCKTFIRWLKKTWSTRYPVDETCRSQRADEMNCSVFRALSDRNSVRTSLH